MSAYYPCFQVLLRKPMTMVTVVTVIYYCAATLRNNPTLFSHALLR